MKILVIMLYWYPYEGPLMPIYAGIFRDLMRKGHEITIITSFPHFRKGRLETWENYRGKLYEISAWNQAKVVRCYIYAPVFRRGRGLIYRALNFLSFNISSLLAGAFLGGRVDLVLAPSSPPLTNGMISFLVSIFKRCPMVYNIQDLYPDIAIKMGLVENRFLVALLRLLEKVVYGMAQKIVPISRTMSDSLIEKGVKRAKIEVIENFMDTDLIVPGPHDNSFSRQYGLTEKFVVMYAGSIGILHGAEVLVEAADLLSCCREIIFCFVARGEKKEKVEELARTKGLSNTLFIPSQPEETVSQIWATASVGAVTYRKGLSEFSVASKLLAIMCAGRPVVASMDEESETARIVRKSGCGMVVEAESSQEFAEAVLKIRSEPHVAEEMGQKGLHYVKRVFGREVISNRYEALFHSLSSFAGDSYKGQMS